MTFIIFFLIRYYHYFLQRFVSLAYHDIRKCPDGTLMTLNDLVERMGTKPTSIILVAGYMGIWGRSDWYGLYLRLVGLLEGVTPSLASGVFLLYRTVGGGKAGRSFSDLCMPTINCGFLINSRGIICQWPAGQIASHISCGMRRH